MYSFERISFQHTGNLLGLQSRDFSLLQPSSELFSSLIKDYCMYNFDGIGTAKCIVIKHNLCFCFMFQNHGVMEGDLFYTLPVCGKLFWKYFYAGSHYSFDVYKPVMVSLDQQPPCGYVAHASCGKFYTREGSVCLYWGAHLLYFFSPRDLVFRETEVPGVLQQSYLTLKRSGKIGKIEIQTFILLKQTLILKKKKLVEN